MKCPTCEHEMVRYNHPLEFHKHVCINKNCAKSDIPRLKKAVLSIFKQGNGNYLYYGLVMTYSLYAKRFMITGSNKPVSLRTVAMILSDYGEEV